MQSKSQSLYNRRKVGFLSLGLALLLLLLVLLFSLQGCENPRWGAPQPSSKLPLAPGTAASSGSFSDKFLSRLQ